MSSKAENLLLRSNSAGSGNGANESSAKSQTDSHDGSAYHTPRDRPSSQCSSVAVSLPLAHSAAASVLSSPCASADVSPNLKQSARLQLSQPTLSEQSNRTPGSTRKPYKVAKRHLYPTHRMNQGDMTALSLLGASGESMPCPSAPASTLHSPAGATHLISASSHQMPANSCAQSLPVSPNIGDLCLDVVSSVAPVAPTLPRLPENEQLKSKRRLELDALVSTTVSSTSDSTAPLVSAPPISTSHGPTVWITTVPKTSSSLPVTSDRPAASCVPLTVSSPPSQNSLAARLMNIKDEPQLIQMLTRFAHEQQHHTAGTTCSACCSAASMAAALNAPLPPPAGSVASSSSGVAAAPATGSSSTPAREQTRLLSAIDNGPLPVARSKPTSNSVGTPGSSASAPSVLDPTAPLSSSPPLPPPPIAQLPPPQLPPPPATFQPPVLVPALAPAPVTLDMAPHNSWESIVARVEQSELEQLTRSLAERARLRAKPPARSQSTSSDLKQLQQPQLQPQQPAESASRAQPATATAKVANEFGFGAIASCLEEGDLLLNVVSAAGCYQLTKVCI